MLVGAVSAATSGPAEALADVEACYAAIRAGDTGSASIQPCVDVAANPQLDALTQAQVHSAMAWHYARSGSIDASRNALTSIGAQYQNDPVVQNNLGNMYLAQKQFSAALQAYEMALSGLGAGPARAAVQLNRSMALRALGRYEDAYLAYQSYLDLVRPEPQVRPVMPADNDVPPADPFRSTPRS